MFPRERVVFKAGLRNMYGVPSNCSTYVQKCTSLDARSVLINVTKCPAKSKRKLLVYNFRVSPSRLGSFFLRLGLGLPSLSLRMRVKRTLCDL